MIRPEPITIDGRNGVVVFLDEAGQPVEAKSPQAVVARAIFDDGGRATYAVKPTAVNLSHDDPLEKFPTVREGTGPVSIKTMDVFGRPTVSLKVPLNIKTTQHGRQPVDVRGLEPTQATMPVAGVRAYLSTPRRDPPDVLHLVMRDGRERYVIQEGHTRLAAALLRGEAMLDARVWEFEENSAGDLVPVPRGLQKRGEAKAKALSYREKLHLYGTSEGAFLGWETRKRGAPADRPGGGGGSSGGSSGVMDVDIDVGSTEDIAEFAPIDHVRETPDMPDLGKTRPVPIQAKDLGEAVTAILKGDVVELKDVGQVHTVLEKLAKNAEEAKAKGQKAPKFDLCKVSVAGSNLFCGSALKTKAYPDGIPRVKMPQLAGEPLPGTEAAKLPRDPVSGEINAAGEFLKHLESRGIGTKREPVPASSLKASQVELVGPTVAGMMTAKPDPVTGKTYDPGEEPIFISSDDYVLDGHHRWAAVVGRDAADGTLGQSRMNVIRVDAPISELLRRSKAWTKKFGIKPKDVTGQKTALRMIFDGSLDHAMPAYREKLHRLRRDL